MHFTRVRMLNPPYFLFRNIEKMAHFVQKKPCPQQMSNIYHYSLIKMIVLHHLSLLNISWETFIAHDIFRGPQIPPPMSQESGGPSSSAQVKTYEKAKDLDEHYYEPYIKPWYINEVKILFPFRFLEDKYVPVMKIIMKYFTEDFPSCTPITSGSSCILPG